MVLDLFLGVNVLLYSKILGIYNDAWVLSSDFLNVYNSPELSKSSLIDLFSS
jgi:hypothetical protein